MCLPACLPVCLPPPSWVETSITRDTGDTGDKRAECRRKVQAGVPVETLQFRCVAARWNLGSYEGQEIYLFTTLLANLQLPPPDTSSQSIFYTYPQGLLPIPAPI
jgi:hypothetical protein